MAHSLAESELPLEDEPSEEQRSGSTRRCRGRPKLTDSDRVQRRLESRKKYDVRRVYLGESHKLWSEVRRKTSLSDAGLADYLILLYSTFGENCQQKHCMKACVTSLRSLVRWYEEHSCSCPNEPHLRALRPHSDFSTAAVWKCDSQHAFVQYLISSPGEAGGSDHEEDRRGKLARGDAGRRKRKEAAAHKQRRGAGSYRDRGVPPLDANSFIDVPSALLVPLEERPEDAAATLECSLEVSTKDAPLSQESSWNGSAMENPVVLSESLSGSVHLDSELLGPASMQEPDEMFDTPNLQSVVAGGDVADHRAALEASQLIIITGPTYEALASEGIQLNMAAGAVDDLTCAAMEGYDQAAKLAAEEDEQLLQPLEDNLELSCESNQSRSVARCLDLQGEQARVEFTGHSVVRSRRNRRGQVIEADGMLKMFHCPYEGCSQVYVAISSFQNHVNLVHRKGRTKVCPHPGCGKKFYLSNHLQRHMIIHSGVRDFICETCGKSFKRKNHLEVHRRTHTGETPLQCEICGYQCRQRASLNWHMKKHASEAHYRFACEFCDKRFERLDSVKFHKLKSHPDKQNP
ncbi:zinc finger protein 653 [Neosynchiropus ocellatus]